MADDGGIRAAADRLRGEQPRSQFRGAAQNEGVRHRRAGGDAGQDGGEGRQRVGPRRG